MLDNDFRIQYARLVSTYGAGKFNSAGANQLWPEMHDLPQKIAVDVFDWVLKNFPKSRPPTIEDLLKKVESAKYVEQKRLENLKTHDPDRLSSGGLESFLQSTGYSSLKELVRNNFKPKS